MSSIYRNALLTIAAVGATDSSSGCFAERIDFRSRFCKLGLKVPQGVLGQRSGETYARFRQDDKDDSASFVKRGRERGLLDFWGWTLHERVLSTRTWATLLKSCAGNVSLRNGRRAGLRA